MVQHGLAGHKYELVHSLLAVYGPVPHADHIGVEELQGADAEEEVGPLYGIHLSRLPVHWDTAPPEKPLAGMDEASGALAQVNVPLQSSAILVPP